MVNSNNNNGVICRKSKEKKKTILSKDIKERLLRNYPLFSKKINFTLPMQQSLVKNNKKKHEHIYNGFSFQQSHKSSINSGRTNYLKLNNKIKMMNNTTTNINKPQTCLSFYNLTNKANISKYRSIYSNKKKPNDTQLINRILNTIQIDSPDSNTFHHCSNTTKQKLKKNHSQQCTIKTKKKNSNNNNNSSTVKIKTNKKNCRYRRYSNIFICNKSRTRSIFYGKNS